MDKLKTIRKIERPSVRSESVGIASPLADMIDDALRANRTTYHFACSCGFYHQQTAWAQPAVRPCPICSGRLERIICG
jgi:hypothetical protein